MTQPRRRIPDQLDLQRMLDRAGMALTPDDFETIATAFPAIAAQLQRLYAYDLSSETYPFHSIFPETLQ